MSYQRPWPKLRKYITKFGFIRHISKLMIQIDLDALVPRQVSFIYGSVFAFSSFPENLGSETREREHPCGFRISRNDVRFKHGTKEEIIKENNKKKQEVRMIGRKRRKEDSVRERSIFMVGILGFQRSLPNPSQVPAQMGPFSTKGK